VTFAGLLWFAGAGVLTAYVGRVAYYATVERLGAMRAATLQRLNPFFAVVMGVAVLHESIAGRTGVGLVLVVASFGVLVLAARGREGARCDAWARRAHGLPHRHRLRARLLDGLPAAQDGPRGSARRILGAAVGCAIGALLFAATAAFNPRYARAVRATFAHPNPWFVGAGVLSSSGQVLYFAALNELPMSRVALIVSMEVFITLFLGYLFLRRRSALPRGSWRLLSSEWPAPLSSSLPSPSMDSARADESPQSRRCRLPHGVAARIRHPRAPARRFRHRGRGAARCLPRALEQWPVEGVPANPRAWLVSAGRFKAIDGIRRNARFADVEDFESFAETIPAEEVAEAQEIEDDRLRSSSRAAIPRSRWMRRWRSRFARSAG
jgi:uncharacterized membrane protein